MLDKLSEENSETKQENSSPEIIPHNQVQKSQYASMRKMSHTHNKRLNIHWYVALHIVCVCMSPYLQTHDEKV